MPPQKLSESEKQEILKLYRETEETTSTLASRYGVSNTTISRILKQTLSDQEYEALIHQKRIGGFRQQPVAEPKPLAIEADELVDPIELEAPDEDEEDELEAPDEDEPDELDEPDLAIAAAPAELPIVVERPTAPAPPIRRQRRRLTAGADAPLLESKPLSQSSGLEQLPLLELSAAMESQNSSAQAGMPEAAALEEIIEGDLLRPEEDFAHLDDEDDEDDLDDDLDEDEDGFDDDGIEGDLSAVHIQSKTFIQVLPLSEASLPKTCYLVVDRASELITRPLRDFADLGQIPVEEVQARILPIFDNHRVARRFSRRMQRVVKVPDGRVIHKVSAYLQAKGITRLLIDGQVYSI